MEETLIKVIKILSDDSFRFAEDQLQNSLELIFQNHPELFKKVEKEIEKEKLKKQIDSMQQQLKDLYVKYEAL